MPHIRKFDWEKAAEDYKSGLSLEAVGKRHGVSPAAIQKALRKLGIASRGTHAYKNAAEPRLRRLMAGESQKQIAASEGISPSTFHHFLGCRGFVGKKHLAQLRSLNEEQLRHYFDALDKDGLLHIDAFDVAREYLTPVEERRRKRDSYRLRQVSCRHFWSIDEIEKLREFVKMGYTFSRIARELTRSTYAVGAAARRYALEELAAHRPRIDVNKVSVCRRQNNIERRGFDVPPERDAEYKLFKKKGFTLSEIKEIMKL